MLVNHIQHTTWFFINVRNYFLCFPEYQSPISLLSNFCGFDFCSILVFSGIQLFCLIFSFTLCYLYVL